MMKTKTIIPFLALIAILCYINVASATAQKPKLSQVIHHFFKAYKWNETEMSLLKFAKKPTGWELYEIDPNNPKKNQYEHLFWSQKTGDYLDLDLAKAEPGKEKDDYKAYTATMLYDAYGFERCMYYGYDGWDKDIIDAYGSKSDLSDTLLEGLSRAYSSYAQSAFSNQYGSRSDAVWPDELKFGKNPGEERVQFFIKYANKDIATYKLLLEKNPDYITMVGNSFQKYSCECMWMYSSLCMYNRCALASQFLPKDLFGSLALSVARNYLKSLAADAVLFVDGDMDTYATWYLQETENYRRDVSIVNVSLLGLPVYVNSIRKGYMHQPPVRMRLDSSALVAIKDYYYLRKNTDMAQDPPFLSVPVFMKIIAGKEKNNKYVYELPDYPTPVINGDEFRDSINQANIKNDHSLAPYSFPYEPNITYSVKMSYILTSDLYIMDILSANDWNRPVYSTLSNMEWADLLHIRKYFAKEPMLMHLIPVDIEAIYFNNNIGYPDTAGAYNILMNLIGWDDADTKHSMAGNTRYTYSENIRYQFFEAAKEIGNVDKAKARKLINRMMRLLPFDKNPGGMSLISLASESKNIGLTAEETKLFLKEGVKGLKMEALEQSKTNDITGANAQSVAKLKYVEDIITKLGYPEITKEIEDFIMAEKLDFFGKRSIISR